MAIISNLYHSVKFINIPLGSMSVSYVLVMIFWPILVFGRRQQANLNAATANMACLLVALPGLSNYYDQGVDDSNGGDNETKGTSE